LRWWDTRLGYSAGLGSPDGFMGWVHGMGSWDGYLASILGYSIVAAALLDCSALGGLATGLGWKQSVMNKALGTVQLLFPSHSP